MRHVSRCLLGIVTCVVPVFIAACYGMAYTFSQRGRVIDKGSKTGVSGMRVQCRNKSDAMTDETHTQSDGRFHLSATSESACATVAVDDDHEAGARYASTRVPSNGDDLTIEVSALP